MPGKHGAQHIAAWFAAHGKAPVTVSFGHDPLLLALGGTEVPRGVSELEYAGRSDTWPRNCRPPRT